MLNEILKKFERQENLNKKRRELEQKISYRETVNHLRKHINNKDLNKALSLHREILNNYWNDQESRDFESFIINELNDSIKFNNKVRIKKILDNIKEYDNKEFLLKCDSILINYILSISKSINGSSLSSFLYVMGNIRIEFDLGCTLNFNKVILNMCEERITKFIDEGILLYERSERSNDNIKDKITPVEIDVWIEESCRVIQVLLKYPVNEGNSCRIKELYERLELRYFISCINREFFHEDNSAREDLKYLIGKIGKRSTFMKSENTVQKMKEFLGQSSYNEYLDVFKEETLWQDKCE
jgi:hypothetical protein